MNYLPNKSLHLLNYQNDQFFFNNKNKMNDLVNDYFDHSEYLPKNCIAFLKMNHL